MKIILSFELDMERTVTLGEFAQLMVLATESITKQLEPIGRVRSMPPKPVPVRVARSPHAH